MEDSRGRIYSCIVLPMGSGSIPTAVAMGTCRPHITKPVVLREAGSWDAELAPPTLCLNISHKFLKCETNCVTQGNCGLGVRVEQLQSSVSHVAQAGPQLFKHPKMTLMLIYLPSARMTVRQHCLAGLCLSSDCF